MAVSAPLLPADCFNTRHLNRAKLSTSHARLAGAIIGNRHGDVSVLIPYCSASDVMSFGLASNADHAFDRSEVRCEASSCRNVD